MHPLLPRPERTVTEGVSDHSICFLHCHASWPVFIWQRVARLATAERLVCHLRKIQPFKLSATLFPSRSWPPKTMLLLRPSRSASAASLVKRNNANYVTAQRSSVRKPKGRATHQVRKSSRPSPSEKPPTRNYCVTEHARTEEGEGLGTDCVHTRVCSARANANAWLHEGSMRKFELPLINFWVRPCCGAALSAYMSWIKYWEKFGIFLYAHTHLSCTAQQEFHM